MSDGSIYKRDPIVEALLDIQVGSIGETSLESLQKCQLAVKNDYPNRRTTQVVTSKVSYAPAGVSTSASQVPAGYIFTSKDERQWFQARRDGFTFNRLAPYKNWESFVTEANRLWKVYYRAARPTEYKRIALRYINRFDFSMPIVNLETYFRTYIEISRDLPQSMANFFVQVHLPIAEIDAMASITQTNGKPTEQGHASIMLDIDLYRTVNLPKGDELWPLFEDLRTWKNRIFDNCLTQAGKDFLNQ